MLLSFPLVPEILSKHDEMEELLESYLIDFNALESKIELTRNQIQNAEELVSCAFFKFGLGCNYFGTCTGFSSLFGCWRVCMSTIEGVLIFSVP